MKLEEKILMKDLIDLIAVRLQANLPLSFQRIQVRVFYLDTFWLKINNLRQKIKIFSELCRTTSNNIKKR